MKRFESRNISRRRKKIEALSPCSIFSTAMGVNPFASILQSSGIAESNKADEQIKTEKHIQHKLKMKADQRSAKARSLRKKNKV